MIHLTQRDRPIPTVPKEVFKLWADWADSKEPYERRVLLWDKFQEEKKKWNIQDGKWTPANLGNQTKMF